MALSLARRMEIRAAIDSGTEEELMARMNQESISAHLDKLDALIGSCGHRPFLRRKGWHLRSGVRAERTTQADAASVRAANEHLQMSRPDWALSLGAVAFTVAVSCAEPLLTWL